MSEHHRRIDTLHLDDHKYQYKIIWRQLQQCLRDLSGKPEFHLDGGAAEKVRDLRENRNHSENDLAQTTKMRGTVL